MSGRAKPMRVGIDVRYLSHGLLGGVHTYVRRLVPELMEAAPEDEFVLYADRKAPFELSPPGRAVVRMLPWRSALSSVVNDWRLASRMAADGVDVAFFPANYGFGPPAAATVITVHDALNLLPLAQTMWGRGRARSLRTEMMTVYLHLMTVRAIARATAILTVSAFSREQIAAASGRPIEDIIAVHHGAAPVTAVASGRIQEVLGARGLRPPYILADGLKNPGVLLSAWRRLPSAVRSSHSLVFFARHARVLPVLEQGVAIGEATLLVGLSADELAALYAGAAAFVFPSWIEGFGIPLLEAMSYGTPIVASDRGSIPEVVGEAALLVDAEDAEALASALNRVLTSEAEAARLRALGLARVANFTWRRAAELTRQTLRQARDDWHGRRTGQAGAHERHAG
jgi:glycosyltransferase involved in cell wall biosynthesis